MQSSSHRVERWAWARFMIVSELNGSERRFGRIHCPYLKGPASVNPPMDAEPFGWVPAAAGSDCAAHMSPKEALVHSVDANKLAFPCRAVEPPRSNSVFPSRCIGVRSLRSVGPALDSRIDTCAGSTSYNAPRRWVRSKWLDSGYRRPPESISFHSPAHRAGSPILRPGRAAVARR